MSNYTIFGRFENPRRGRQARNLTTNVPKILDLKWPSEQMFSKNCRWVPQRKEWKVHIIIGGFGRQVAATRCGHSSQGQIVSCEKVGLRNRSLSPQQVAQNQIRLNLCGLLRRQNSDVETKISKKIVQYTRGDLSLRRVAQLAAGTYRPTCTHGVICRRDIVAVTRCLVCANLN